MEHIKRIPSTDYWITSDGEVYSVKGGKTRLLKNRIQAGGYYQVNLHIEKLSNQKLVHRLVGIYFIPNPENKPQINHKDGNKLNNHYTNLEWVSPSENMEHARKNNLVEPGKRKLNMEKAEEIRNSSEKTKTLAQIYQVSRSVIIKIKNNQAWKTKQ